MNKIRWLLLLGIVGLVAACAQEPEKLQPLDVPSPVETAALDPTPARAGVTILADGAVQVVQPALPLAFESGGRLLAVYVQAGDQVQAGDLIATLDDRALREAVANAELQVAQSRNNLDQLMVQTDSETLDGIAVLAELDVAEAETNLAIARADLDELLNWTPKEDEVALAEATLAGAQGQFYSAAGGDAASQYQVETARIALEQAQRELANVQENHDSIVDSARDWEPGIEQAREAAAASLQRAQDNVAIAEANLNSAQATATYGSSASAQSNVLSAEQALADLLAGPKEEELESAQQTVTQRALALDRARISLAATQLRVEQASIALQLSELSLAQAQTAAENAQLVAPWTGTVFRVEVAPGALVAGGTPIVTLLDLTQLAFHTMNLSEHDLAQISPGQEAIVTLKAYPDEPIAATVVRIGLQAGEFVGDAATFPVILALNNNDLDIRPGMTGRVEFFPR